MTKFGYAQSNSLLKQDLKQNMNQGLKQELNQEVDDHPADNMNSKNSENNMNSKNKNNNNNKNDNNDNLPKKPSPNDVDDNDDNNDAPQTIPRWKIEPSDNNELPAEVPGSPPPKLKHQNSPMSNLAASTSADATADISTVAAISVANTNTAVTVPGTANITATATVTVDPDTIAVAPDTDAPASAPKTTSTGKTKVEIKPAKKTSHAKHKLTNGVTTVTATATKATKTISKPSDTTADASGSHVPTNTDLLKKTRNPRVRKPRRVVSKEKEYIPANEQPTKTDVVGGRGGRSNHHPGNRPYWMRILESRAEYINRRSDLEKAQIATGILRYVQTTLRGRFLNIDSKTKRWFVLPNDHVLDKIKQALRDKYVPYWARELQIEDKKHYTLATMLQTTESVLRNNTTMIRNINNKRPHQELNSMLPGWGSPYANLHNPSMLSPAVAMAAMNVSRAKAVTASNLAAAAAMNVSRAEAATASNLAAAAAAAAAATQKSDHTMKKTKNNLDFLLGLSSRRPVAQTSTIPTWDDILKYKVDQMPTFGATSMAHPNLMAAAMANASAASIPSYGMNPYHSGIPTSWMNSIGLGGLPGKGDPMSEAVNYGYGIGGNPGAPALPPSVMNPLSMGALQTLDMQSLDKFLEAKIAGLPTLGTSESARQSLGMLNALVGSSFDSATSHSANSASSSSASPMMAMPAAMPAAEVPTGSKKTDWNAMYARALTNPKGV